MQPQANVILDPHADDPYLSVAEARSLYRAGDAAHDFDHVLRVTRTALHLAQAEGADRQIVRLAALLHDVPGDIPDDLIDDLIEGMTENAKSGSAFTMNSNAGRAGHHHAAADFARQWLRQRGMAAAAIDQVVHCIQAHRFRDRSIQPETLEAQCLYDADKLDSIGAIGIGRAFAYAGAHGSRLWTQPVSAAPDLNCAPKGEDYTPVHEYVYKLNVILSALHTATARRIAARRHAFMAEFFDQLDAEMQGLA
jgi:uncharacterized protein